MVAVLPGTRAPHGEEVPILSAHRDHIGLAQPGVAPEDGAEEALVDLVNNGRTTTPRAVLR